MTILHGIKHLHKYMLNQAIIPKIPTPMQNLGEEIMVGSEIHDDVRIEKILDDAVQGDDVRMGTGNLMERDFADVQLPLACSDVRLRVHETFHSVGFRTGRASVYSTVDDAVSPDAEDFHQLKGVVVDEGAE